MIRWLARYEVTVDSGAEVRRFRWHTRPNARWALRMAQVLADEHITVTARDRWTGRRFA